jgi:hypothetical protein
MFASRLPCSIDALLGVLDLAPVRASDVFVDIGLGPERAAARGERGYQRGPVLTV